MTALCGVAVFLAAFLLFQMQPLLGKALLPRFGGSPSVWIVCLLFFQTMLFLGALYAHLLGRLPPRRQTVVHLLALVFIFPSIFSIIKLMILMMGVVMLSLSPILI